MVVSLSLLYLDHFIVVAPRFGGRHLRVSASAYTRSVIQTFFIDLHVTENTMSYNSWNRLTIKLEYPGLAATVLDFLLPVLSICVFKTPLGLLDLEIIGAAVGSLLISCPAVEKCV